MSKARASGTVPPLPDFRVKLSDHPRQFGCREPLVFRLEVSQRFLNRAPLCLIDHRSLQVVVHCNMGGLPSRPLRREMKSGLISRELADGEEAAAIEWLVLPCAPGLNQYEARPHVRMFTIPIKAMPLVISADDNPVFGLWIGEEFVGIDRSRRKK